MNSFADVIKELGGYVQVAQALGVTPGTVSSMQSRGSIPPTYWHALAARAKNMGKDEITLDTLARLYAERPKPEPSAPPPEPAVEGRAA